MHHISLQTSGSPAFQHTPAPASCAGSSASCSSNQARRDPEPQNHLPQSPRLSDTPLPAPLAYWGSITAEAEGYSSSFPSQVAEQAAAHQEALPRLHPPTCPGKFSSKHFCLLHCSLIPHHTQVPWFCFVFQSFHFCFIVNFQMISSKEKKKTQTKTPPSSPFLSNSSSLFQPSFSKFSEEPASSKDQIRASYQLG